ncbi:hypothetical protein BCR44DRAFT_1451261 [Catenaria anguillulae PL171]|uniref:Uncharacterized protein n=1 Tax=Catenaria anguillulae PL171 TaxID=765915 RepID=A0A1Y2H5Z1_9FUNG|nr:hypothetical protein BCR44DRAFT_1451261 [Catenaria anguillulae PL171]
MRLPACRRLCRTARCCCNLPCCRCRWNHHYLARHLIAAGLGSSLLGVSLLGSAILGLSLLAMLALVLGVSGENHKQCHPVPDLVKVSREVLRSLAGKNDQVEGVTSIPDCVRCEVFGVSADCRFPQSACTTGYSRVETSKETDATVREAGIAFETRCWTRHRYILGLARRSPRRS